MATGATPRGDGLDVRAEARFERALFGGPDPGTAEATPLVVGLFLGLVLAEVERREAPGRLLADAEEDDPLVGRALSRRGQLESAGRYLTVWREELLLAAARGLLDRLDGELLIAALLESRPDG